MLGRRFAKLLAEKQLSVLTRFLSLQEYQSKKLIERHGLNIQRFVLVRTAEEAEEKLKDFHSRYEEYVVKAQILAGGRGKGRFTSGLKGGVKLTTCRNEALFYIKEMIGHRLVTKQTPPDGVEVKSVMIAESVPIARETYLAVLLDRDNDGTCVVGSPAGGMDIEEVAEKHPDLIYKVPFTKTLPHSEALDLAKKLLFTGDVAEEAAQQIMRLVDMFGKTDATQIEINPFGLTTDNQVICFDAKLNFDDSAEFRQKEIFALHDESESDPIEEAAAKAKLSYVRMDGNIACMVNGAGLALATMDVIKLKGGEPANFLDVGGMANVNQVVEALKIITSDSRVKVILVNIFGGIVNCATIANGLREAFQHMKLNVPLVVRLEGTNVVNARKILDESGLPVTTAVDLDDAAIKAVSSLQ